MCLIVAAVTNLGTLAVLEWIGVSYAKSGHEEFRHPCPCCGTEAVTTPWYTECSNRACELRVAGPMDLMAWYHGGDYRKAAAYVNRQVGRDMVGDRLADALRSRRQVMRIWLSLCHAPMKFSNSVIFDNLMHGGSLNHGQESVCLVNEEELAALSRLSALSGASTAGFVSQGYPVSAVSVVQSVPWLVDHLVVHQPDHKAVISWEKGKSGFGGLIGMAGVESRRFAPTVQSALSIQRILKASGTHEEIGFWVDLGSATVPRCEFQPEKMTLVVDTAEQMVSGSRVLRRFGIEDSVAGCGSGKLFTIEAPPVRTTKWRHIRMGYIASSIKSFEKRMSPETIKLLETSAPPREEVAALAGVFRKEGRIALSDELMAHLDNRVISEDRNVKIRETSGSYEYETQIGKSALSNFSLRFTHNLVFRDSSEVFHVARTVCGHSTYEVMLTGASLDSTTTLAESMRFQHATRAKQDAALPVIIDTVNFRKHVLPYLRKEVSRIGSQNGVSSLGWSIDRQAFLLPGMMVDMSGRQLADSKFHPNMPALRLFDTSADWTEVGLTEVPAPARDFTAMVLAQCARFYLRLPVSPICVDQKSPARALALAVSKALGQKDVFELNANMRDSTHGMGARGYPVLAHGYSLQQAQHLQACVILLTDGGYCADVGDVYAFAEPMGRAIRHSLVRMVEWLMATNGEDYVESPSSDIHNSLLREGRWLLDAVCKMQAWEGEDITNPLDQWLEDCGYDFLSETLRMTIDLKILIPADILRDEVISSIRELDPDVELGSVVSASAVALLPAMARFFGREMNLDAVEP